MLKKLHICLLLILCSFTVHGANFDQQFNSLVQQTIPHASVGIAIRDPQTGAMLFDYRSEDNFYPASNTKLFTGAAALKLLGPHFQYQTTLHGQINHDTAQNISLVFKGDPSLTVKDVTDLLNTLKTKGVKKITGNVIIDDTAFSGPVYAPGWTFDSIAWAYSAPVTTIILNENKIAINLLPSELGKKISIKQADLVLPLFPITSNVRAVSAHDAELHCRFSADIYNNDIQLNGCWPIDNLPMRLELAFDKPRLVAKHLVENHLKKLNIAFVGKVTFAASGKAPVIAVKKSAPLKKLLITSLADSNNLYTESFTKTIGLVYANEGSFQAGTRAITAILNEGEFNFNKMHLSDGSGQSRYNLVSPFLISELLCNMKNDPQFPIFYAALSVNGKSGTLSSRMNHKTLLGKMVAKTGSCKGTSALSGYFTARSGKQYVFSLMINQSTLRSRELKVFEDKLFHLLYEEPWEVLRS